MANKKIFFSYSRIDGAAFAQRLALDLKQQNFDVWIDQEDIRAGSEWDLEIEKALETCDSLLFLESEKSVTSTHVLDEVYYALEQKKKVIPLIVKDSKTPYRLQRLQHIDFSTDYDKGFVQLLKALAEEHLTAPGQPNNAAISKQPPFSGGKTTRYLIAILFLIVASAAIYYVSSRKASAPVTITAEENTMPVENYAGRWKLTAVQPQARLGEGFMIIEKADSVNVDIRSSFQFYYTKSNDTLFTNVFNGFARCAACKLQQEMKLVTEDASVGSQHYSIVKVPGKQDAADTVADRGYNETIKASCSLQFTDSKNAVIKVQSAAKIKLDSGVELEPFTYVFSFVKSE